MIETAVEIVRGLVPEPYSLRVHSETFHWGNHPSRHRKERDDAALLTQEGNSPSFAVTNILCKRVWAELPDSGWEFHCRPAISVTKINASPPPRGSRPRIAARLR